ncbi:hypothetical protein BGX31_008688 [Mortierella sp. GBA43]|nr:hypothetical protein BGX31_008688 [Mortierella sp. GBA43]
MAQFSTLLSSTLTPKLVDDTAAQFCSYPTCPAASITLVQNTVKQNCVNASDPSTAALISGAASLYDPAKEGLCQKVSPTNGTYCVTVLAESMIAYLNKNPTPLGIKIFSNTTALQQYVNQMPTNLLCTSCNKAIINPLNNYVAKNRNTLNSEVLKWADVLKTGVSSKCGADFVNGAAPTTSDPSGAGGKSSANLFAESSAIITLLGAIFSSAAILL